jgi:hypothetical protein
MRVMKAFVLGTVVFAVLAYAAAVALALSATEGGWSALRIAVGPFLLVAVEQDGATTVTTFGTGIVLVGLLGGAVNAAAAAALARRGHRASDSVD